MSELWSVTVPGYATGAGTIALVTVTALMLSAERRRERRAALADARKIFGRSYELEVEPAAPRRKSTRMQAVEVVNASDNPIFDVVTGGEFDSFEDDGSFTRWIPGVHQGLMPFVLPHDARHELGTWMQGRHRDATVPEMTDMDVLYWTLDSLRVDVEWTDARGTRWRRHGNGEPEPATSRTAAGTEG